MKSGKQRRAELQAKREARRAKAASAEADRKWAKRVQRLHTKEQEGVAVNAAKLATNNSYCAPDYLQRGYYLDVEFTCQGCGLEQVWTAKQQKWWYEVAKGSPFSTARLCRPCRRKERERRTAARRIHLEGLASKQRGRHDSAQAERRR